VLPGVEKIGVVMATPVNMELLKEGDLLAAEGKDATPNDLIIAVRADTEEAVSQALSHAEDLLSRPAGASGQTVCKTIRTAVSALPEANVALISVPGEYAAVEARRALELGLHALIFSDNVPLEEEIELKRFAGSRGLLLMGPDCGTAILGGAGLGFANAVSSGEVGIVAASGTGAQAVSAALQERGLGLSHLIGTGGRDTSDAVGGSTMLQGMQALSQDETTKAIVVLSKIPGPKTLVRLLACFETCPKPIVAYLLGAHPGLVRAAGAHPVVSLDHAAELVEEILRSKKEGSRGSSLIAMVSDLGKDLPSGGLLQGFFAGGTLAQEAHAILTTLLSDLVSNLKGPLDESTGKGHHLLDLGADEYTVGHPQPMMAPTAQATRIEAAAEEGQAAVILFDVVLGHGAHPDPAGILAPSAEKAFKKADEIGKGLTLIASVCGTDSDPQNRADQEKELRDAGVFVERDNARAAAIAGLVAVGGSSVSVEEEGLPVALPSAARVVNIGTDWFAEALQAQEIPVVQVEWSPPAGGDKELGAMLELLG
jgi:succinyl-CoA synthetase alpha subunit